MHVHKELPCVEPKTNDLLVMKRLAAKIKGIARIHRLPSSRPDPQPKVEPAWGQRDQLSDPRLGTLQALG